MKKRNPTDSTIRNTKAANKKFADLKAEIRLLWKAIEVLTNTVNCCQAKCKKKNK